jgi:hypothetical protein
MEPASFFSGLGVAAKALWTFAAVLFGALLAVLAFGYNAVASTLSFLAETWIIQTFVAAWVAFQLQEVSLVNRRKRDRLQAAYQRKVDAAKALYSLISKRTYASRRYLGVLEGEQDKIAEERERYRAAVSEWNEHAQLHQVTLLLEFDSYFGLLVDHSYNPTFATLDSLLRKQRLLVENERPVSPATSRSIRSALDDLNRVSLDVFREMLKIAEKDRNIMDEKVAISEENVDHISYGRLFKSLVQPGV